MYYFILSLGTAAVALVTYIVSSMVVVGFSSDSGTRGINGLQIFSLLYYPFVAIIMFPIVLIIRRLVGDFRFERVSYSVAVLIGIIVGVLSGL